MHKKSRRLRKNIVDEDVEAEKQQVNAQEDDVLGSPPMELAEDVVMKEPEEKQTE